MNRWWLDGWLEGRGDGRAEQYCYTLYMSLTTSDSRTNNNETRKLLMITGKIMINGSTFFMRCWLDTTITATKTFIYCSLQTSTLLPSILLRRRRRDERILTTQQQTKSTPRETYGGAARGKEKFCWAFTASCDKVPNHLLDRLLEYFYSNNSPCVESCIALAKRKSRSHCFPPCLLFSNKLSTAVILLVRWLHLLYYYYYSYLTNRNTHRYGTSGE